MQPLRIRRPLVLVLLVLLALSAASPAAATEPTKSPFAFIITTTFSDLCGFPIDVVMAISGTEIAYFDQSGAVTRVFDDSVEQDTFTANGKTLVGIPYVTNNEFLVDSSGNLTNWWVHGFFEKVPLPDGSLFISVGRADVWQSTAQVYLSPDKGNPGNVAGFCAALSQ